MSINSYYNDFSKKDLNQSCLMYMYVKNHELFFKDMLAKKLCSVLNVIKLAMINVKVK